MKRLRKKELENKVVDAHSHTGVALGSYGRAEYPYAQTLEGLYYRQLRGGVDINIVFPFTSDLYFDLPRLTAGKYVKARDPVSSVPYGVENTLLLREVYDYCPELSPRFLPFVSFDPARETQAQVKATGKLIKRYPVYGIKINPVICQSPVTALLKEGENIIEFARKHDLPVLFHTSSLPEDVFSYAGKAFEVIDANPDIRFCLAHCILFSKRFLDRAVQTPNVWIDTAAFKIQVELCVDLMKKRVLKKNELVDADFSDHKSVFKAMCGLYGKRLLWGTDSPAYSYICRRKLSARKWQEFNYKAVYEDEVELLREQTPRVKKMISNVNTIKFLTG